MTARRLLLAVGLLLCALALYLAKGDWNPFPDTTRPVPGAGEFWRNRHHELVDRSQQGHAGPIGVLFLGDSLTHAWDVAGKDVWKERFERWHPANYGIGGDLVENTLWRITEGRELDGVDPRVIVLLIGTNNLKHDSSSEIADGIEAVVQAIRERKPRSKLLLLGILPRSAKEDGDGDEIPASALHPGTRQVNALLARLADGKVVRYLDIGPKFLNDRGGLDKAVMPDFLHLSAKGYQIWADAITPTVEEMLKD